MTPWKDKQLARFDQTYFQFNEHKNFLSSENKKTVDDIYKDYVEQISNDDIVFGLIHNDFHANHVVVGKGKVTGIIDFEWASFGDPLWDFQKLSTHLGEGSDAFFVNFLKGYGMETFSKKELIRYKMYCIEQAIWQIDRTKHSDHGFPEEGIRQGYEIIKKINTLNS
jgi:aminoglycoside phosphotransferase (APT) family kinase protein